MVMREREYKHLEHTFDPVYDRKSKVLILGSFPSVKSREHNFYYGHPQNRFWKILSGLLENELPCTIDEKKEMLLKENIALWDVIKECDIIGSDDSSIKNVQVNELKNILEVCDIQKIYANGKTASRLYQKFVKDAEGYEIVTLPSTSPANAAFSVERLLEEWGRLLEIN